MALLSVEAIIALILGVPSLIAATLTFWEARRSRLQARAMEADDEIIDTPPIRSSDPAGLPTSLALLGRPTSVTAQHSRAAVPKRPSSASSPVKSPGAILRQPRSTTPASF
ncbi:uncharacterized protein K441DRAFT_667276 [Cenococcum geophilum 1.58]|uniref:uncharacterized protein n=1 Tax=Cenococcum geophilum 1.58 TaxID=794803 RepID=UPI00358DECB6|nr:hypothetical protein K441DRAFT_667276 [Cenococcum geophilum 1.58]